MGESTEKYNARLGISREEQDEFSARSHERAAAAMKEGRFDSRARLRCRSRSARVTRWSSARTRACARAPPPRASAKLRPAFAADGTITAGSASQISDGGCALVVMSRRKAEELGAPILAEIGAAGFVAGPDASLQSQPANAIAQALAKEGLQRRRPRSR